MASLGLLTGHTPAITAIRISPRKLESEQPLQHFPSVYLAPVVGEALGVRLLHRSDDDDDLPIRLYKICEEGTGRDLKPNFTFLIGLRK